MGAIHSELCEVVAGRLPSRARYEDAEFLLFDDKLK